MCSSDSEDAMLASLDVMTIRKQRITTEQFFQKVVVKRKKRTLLFRRNKPPDILRGM